MRSSVLPARRAFLSFLSYWPALIAFRLTFTETVRQTGTGTLSTAAGANSHFTTASVIALFNNGTAGVSLTWRIVHTLETPNLLSPSWCA